MGFPPNPTSWAILISYDGNSSMRHPVQALAARAFEANHKENEMKATIAMLVAAAFLIGGCNTIAGAGKDIEAGGEGAGNGQDVKQKM